MATDQEKTAEIKLITDLVQANYNILTNTAKNLSGLVILGRATCQEIKAYNVFALSTYYAQAALLTQLRALGKFNVPEVPKSPTWFAWKGVSGDEAYRVDCGSVAGVAGMAGMSGVLAAAIASTQVANPQYVSPDAIQIVWGDRPLPSASSVPTSMQIMKAGDGGLAGFQTLGDLGISTIIIIIASAVVAISAAVAIAFLASASSDNSISKASITRTNAEVKNYDTLIATRMSCLDKCLANKGSIEQCRELCSAIVTTPPDLSTDKKKPAGGWGTLEQVGFATLSAGALYVGYRLWLKHRANVAEV